MEKGLFKKYILSRTDGKPINPENEYFILKVAGEGDPEHIEACRKAVLTYADNIAHYLPGLAADLKARYSKPEKETTPLKQDTTSLTDNVVYYDPEKEQFYILLWPSGNPTRHYIELPKKEKEGFAVGKKVVITDNIHGHEFRIGDVVTLIELPDSYDMWLSRKEGEATTWYISEEEAVVISGQ